MLWIVTPKISITVYAIALTLIGLWRLADVMEKRTTWFLFLKATDICAFLFLIELAWRWYFVIRGQGESILLSILLGVIGAVFSLVIIAVACLCLVLLYVGFKKLYHFSLAKPANKVNARAKKWIGNNWRTADSIVEKGLWKTFKDYMNL